MTDDFRDLLRRSADEAPVPVPDIAARGVATGQALRRRRNTLIVGGAALASALTITAIFAIGHSPGDAVDEQPAPGPAAPTVSGGLPDDLPVQVQDGEVLVGCGGSLGWAPSVMADGVPGVVTDAEMTETFTQILDDPVYAGEAELSLLPNGPDDVAWRVLRHTDDGLTLGLGTWTDQGPAGGAMVLGLRREGERWIPDGWGDCQLAPLLQAGNSWTHVTKSGTAVDRGSTSVPVRVNEVGCTGSRDPLPYLKEPVLIEDRAAVTVYWTSTPMTGEATCPGNPLVERTISLQQPLGDRALFDGSSYPPSLIVPPAESQQEATQVDLPTSDWQPGEGSRSAQIRGELALDDNGCVRLVNGSNATYAVWPKDFRAEIRGDVLVLIGADGREYAEGTKLQAGGAASVPQTGPAHACLPPGTEVALIQSSVTALN